MSKPVSLRGLLPWAASVFDSYHRPIISKQIRLPCIDFRTSNRWENAISIIRILTQSANGNGGAPLLFDFYVQGERWHSFTVRVRKIIAVTARRFAKGLREARFPPDS